ncbi:hypothetical protein PRIPAC_70531 [Pristionchus pacificus]|nr:hypothetical protein PRIPAC_70531 [Pristionchus pacificus]
MLLLRSDLIHLVFLLLFLGAAKASECYISTAVRDGHGNPEVSFSGSAICDDRSTMCIRVKTDKFEMASCAPQIPESCTNNKRTKCGPLTRDGTCCCEEDNCNNGAAAGMMLTALALALIYLAAVV